MGILGLLLGAAVSVAVLLGALALPPPWARAGAVLAGVGLLYAAGSVLLAGGSLERGFGVVYLVLGGLAGVVCAAPRLLRYVGHEPAWVGLGLGLLCVMALTVAGVALDRLLGAALPAPDPVTGTSVKAQVSQGLSNGILLCAPLAVLALSYVAWRARP